MSEATVRFSDLVKHHNSNKISFDIQGIDLSVVNSIRRTILSEVECIGFYFEIKNHQTISDIVIHQNTSPLHNEFLSHRLSLIPLHFSQEEIDNWDDDKYTFVLEKESMENTNVDVTTEHFKILDQNKSEMPRSFVQRILPPNNITGDYILLTKLKPRANDNQKEKNKVHITLKAKKGCAKKCICWSIASECTFFNTVDVAKAEKALEKKIEDITDKSATEEFIKNFNLLEKFRYFHTDRFGEPSKFTFSIETENSMKPEHVFMNSINYLSRTFKLLKNDIEINNKESEDSIISIDSNTDTTGFFVVSFKNYTHTIGNMLQSYLVNRHVRSSSVSSACDENKKDDDVKLSYAGYNVPHPLEELFILKLKFLDITKADAVRKILKQTFEEIIEMLDNIKTTWDGFIA